MTYVEILRAPRVSPLLLATVLSRLPVGVNPLAVVLFVHERTGSFEAAGVVTGAIAIGMAAGQPALSRLVDRRGNRLMIVIAAVHLVGIAGLLAAGRGGGSVVVLAACAALMGTALAPTTSVLRAIWPRLLASRPDLLAPAYALDSTLVPLTLLSGPLVVSLLAGVASVDVALVLSGVTALAGTAAFVAAAPSGGPARAPGRGLLGALRSPAIQTIVLSQVPVGVAFGCVQVALPAFADEQRRGAYAGVLMALFSLASIVGALLYGARPRRRPPHDVHQRLALLLPLGFLPALAAWSVSSMAVLVLPAGAVVAALVAMRNEIASVSAPAGAATEAVTWPLTALLAGTALGAAIAGVAADGPGWRGAMALAAIAATLSAVVVRARGATLVYARAS